MKLSSSASLLLLATFWAEMACACVRCALIFRDQGDAARRERELRIAKADAAQGRRLLAVWAAHSIPSPS